MKKYGAFLGFLLSVSSMIHAAQLSWIGDNTHTEVYGFIQQQLLKSQAISHTDVIKEREIEIKNLSQKDFKPLIATISEGEIASLLRLLCQSQASCVSITLYDQNGKGIASTGLTKPFTLKTPRNLDFVVGILSEKTMAHPLSYTFMDTKGHRYKENLQKIYQHKTPHYAYLDLQKRNKKDICIGFLSTIAQEKN